MNPTDHDMRGLSADVIEALGDLNPAGKTRSEIREYLLERLPNLDALADLTEEQAHLFALELMFRARKSPRMLSMVSVDYQRERDELLAALKACLDGWKRYLPEGCGEKKSLPLPKEAEHARALIVKHEGG
jgi:hypothetical protein